MKTKLRKYSKPAASILLAVILMTSTLMVGAITSGTASGKGNAADSSSVTIDNAVTADADTGNTPSTIKAKKGKSLTGANAKSRTGATYYLLLSYNDNNPQNMSKNVSSSSATFTVTPSSFGKSSWETGKDYYVGISSSTSYTNMYSQNGSSAKGTVTGPLTAQARDYNIGSIRYHFASFTVTNTAISSVTVSVSGGDNTTYNFSATNPTYSISYGSTTNGSLPSSPTSATSGSTVQFAVTPSEGYQVSSVTYTPSGESATACTLVSGTTYRFTMPSKNVTVNATFSKRSYTVSASEDDHASVSITDGSSHEYASTVTFTVGTDTDYALKSLTVKKGSTNIPFTQAGNTYTFTMPAGDVEITVASASTAGTTTVYFKSATAYVYHPIISVNDGAEVEMTLGNSPTYLDNGSNTNKPRSETGSLRYAWYKAELSNVDLTAPVKVFIRGKDTYMEAKGTFTLTENGSIYLACDNLMEGNTLVDVTNLSAAERDFYDTPLNMIDD